VHRSADGWEPLCTFLGVPVPDEPYPRVNSTNDLKTFGGVERVADDPSAGARGYIQAMKDKAFGT